MPRMEKVIVQNTDTKNSLHLLSISGSTVHFHCSFFQDKVSTSVIVCVVLCVCSFCSVCVCVCVCAYVHACVYESNVHKIYVAIDRVKAIGINIPPPPRNLFGSSGLLNC